MEMISRSFTLESRKSIRHNRSNSTLLGSELVSSDISISKITGYERLSKSMRLDDVGGVCYDPRRNKNKTWAMINKVFSFRKMGEDRVMCGRGAVAVKKSWLAAWMPDPNRRWPVQGW